jgi:cell division protein FtsI (penicillin-binding protein 3)
VIDKRSNYAEMKVNPSVMPDLAGMTIRKAIALAKNLKIELEISGNGIITAQSIKPGERIKFQQKCKVTAQ